MDDLEAISLMVLVTGTVPLPPPSLNYLTYVSKLLPRQTCKRITAQVFVLFRREESG